MPEKYVLACGIPRKFAHRFRNFAEWMNEEAYRARARSASSSEKRTVEGVEVGPWGHHARRDATVVMLQILFTP